MFAVGDKVRCVDAKESLLTRGWVYVVSDVPDEYGVRVHGTTDPDYRYLNARFELVLPTSKREAAEQHAVAGIGPEQGPLTKQDLPVKYPVGSVVRCVSGNDCATGYALVEGDLYTVTGYNGWNLVLDGVKSSWDSARFERYCPPVPASKREAAEQHAAAGIGPEAPEPTKFKTGDSVVIMEPGLLMGKQATVDAVGYDCGEYVSATPNHYKGFSSGSVRFDPRHLRLVLGVTAMSDAQKRKAQPLARGVLDYFPDALLVVAEVSRIGNDQHNPGQPMHWAFGKSMDHADCIMRHLIDRGTADSDEVDHAGKVAWRALALLQTALEKQDPELHARREAQRELAAKGER